MPDAGITREAALKAKYPDDALERLERAELEYTSTHGEYLPELASLLLIERREAATLRDALLPDDGNLVDEETAELNRRPDRKGAYTFHSPPAVGYAGPGFTVAAIRLGDHAHVDIDTGRCTGSSLKGAPDATVVAGRGHAGHLVMQWADWLALRAILAVNPGVHVAEVENPTGAQAGFHAGGRR